ncbi:complement C1q tumor necrosis factor-related protein 2-like isoform X2 [Pecten maximus]|uniref:complement C1q tumor necrosis factor-related protein 2-like isoform X2 n=1 Tax=Pecten maximus TaxID=6579 RepID=UPI0014590FEB|nr:complement C1q tumor necrosis factor-related protein 2-like isoform X2 [Pecten maximus]
MNCVIVLSVVLASLCVGVHTDQLQELRDSLDAIQQQYQSWREDDGRIIRDLQKQIADVRKQNEVTKREVLDVRRKNKFLSKKIDHLKKLYGNLQIKTNIHGRRDAKNDVPLNHGSRWAHHHPCQPATVESTTSTTPPFVHHWLGFGNPVTATATSTATPAAVHHWLGFGNPVAGPTGLTGGKVSSTQATATTLQQRNTGSPAQLGSTASTNQQGKAGSIAQQYSTPQGVSTCQKGDNGPPGPQGIMGHTGPRGPKGEPGQKGEAATAIISDRVAFYATVTQTIDVRMGMTLTFPNVLTNEGNRYDSNTGIFTCGVSGIYVFSWSTGVGKNDFVNTEIVKNDQMVNMQITTGMSTHEMSTSHTAILSLQDNDRVQVVVYRINPHGSSFILGDASSFSGFLLFSY